MRETEKQVQQDEVRKDSTKIYFFVVAIAALLATNIYFYVKYRNSGDRVYELSNEKVSMQAEIDRIEAELDRLTDEKVVLNASLKAARDSVRTTIAELRTQLAQNNLTREQLASAQQEIGRLKGQVSKYLVEVEELRRRQAELISERNALRDEVETTTGRLVELEAENLDLSDKVRVASALKVSGLSVFGLRERSSDRTAAESRARRVDKLRIEFTIADNPLAEKGMHNIYIRVIDPNGNLRTADNSLFEVGGTPMQYTYKTTIQFENDGASYGIDWRDTKGFQKGTYTILLYSDKAVMGQGSVVLK